MTLKRPPVISACIPCLNHWDSLPKTINSILQQTVAVKEILIIDDGSDQACPHPDLAESSEIRLLRLPENRGRGHCRALATKETKGDFILTVDATNALEEAFLEKALPHFDDPRVAAVSGTLTSGERNGPTDRWRSRHLFREADPSATAEPCSMLITYGTLLRRTAIEKVGHFDSSLRYKEDQDMGERLGEAGYVVIGDPAIKIYPTKGNTLGQLLERYARWYLDPKEKPTLGGYLHNIRASIRPMMAEDLHEGDWPAACISLLAPHFQLYHSIIAYRKQQHERKQYT